MQAPPTTTYQSNARAGGAMMLAMAKKRAAKIERGTGETFFAAVAGDADAIHALIGDVRLKTLAEVARAFNVSPDTIKTGWRSAGMPGQAGNYPLAEIIAWKLARQLRAQGREPIAGGDEVTLTALDRKRQADARKATAQAAKEERSNEIQEGNCLYKDEAEQVLSQLIIQTRENFMRLPRAMVPRFPTDIADDLHGELERRIRDILTQMAECEFPQ